MNMNELAVATFQLLENDGLDFDGVLSIASRSMSMDIFLTTLAVTGVILGILVLLVIVGALMMFLFPLVDRLMDFTYKLGERCFGVRR